jgi:hypothetical protein
VSPQIRVVLHSDKYGTSFKSMKFELHNTSLKQEINNGDYINIFNLNVHNNNRMNEYWHWMSNVGWLKSIIIICNVNKCSNSSIKSSVMTLQLYTITQASAHPLSYFQTYMGPCHGSGS